MVSKNIELFYKSLFAFFMSRFYLCCRNSIREVVKTTIHARDPPLGGSKEDTMGYPH